MKMKNQQMKTTLKKPILIKITWIYYQQIYISHKRMLKEQSFQDYRLEEDGSKGDVGLIRFSGLPASSSSSVEDLFLALLPLEYFGSFYFLKDLLFHK